MLGRKTEGSVLCTSCGVLVGVNDPTCYNCGRRNPGLWGFAPVLKRLGNDLGFVNIVTGGTIVMYVLSVVMSREGNQIGATPNQMALQILGASGALPVFGWHWWWTVLTAGWLHGNLIHIFFNVMWIRQLGPEIANLYGAGRMVIIYTIAGIVGFTVSSVFGLLGIPFFGAAGITPLIHRIATQIEVDPRPNRGDGKCGRKLSTTGTPSWSSISGPNGRHATT